MYASLITVAALWGVATGLLLPRAAYRLSVEPEDAWRAGCPAGHPITGPARGWLGRAGCPSCEVTVPSRTATSPGSDAPVPDASATGVPEPPPGPLSPPVPLPPPGPVASAPVVVPPATRSVRYAPSFLVPPLTGLACAALAAATGPRPELAVWLLLAPFAVLLALVDRNVRRLPDQLTLPLAAGAPVLLGLAALLPGDGGTWTTALLGGLALGACYFILFVINPNGMGFGDVKLALSLGVALGWYGWLVLFVGAFAGFLLGSLYGLGLMLLRRAGRGTAIPFGPFMIAGALLGILLGALAAA
ncbi:prepilin peptidase [Streptomyces sp. NPDC051569]|uniref:prepilin peptidase n=1 Tax=Streptomyces sp. NPDC051569 TaxID=3365661 RepID=UPI0037A80538